jgi:hypothetical protein
VEGGERLFVQFLCPYRDQIIRQMFQQHKTTYQKVYSTPAENSHRFQIFYHKARYVDSANRDGITFSVALNKMADWTVRER